MLSKLLTVRQILLLVLYLLLRSYNSEEAGVKLVLVSLPARPLVLVSLLARPLELELALALD